MPGYSTSTDLLGTRRDFRDKVILFILCGEKSGAGDQASTLKKSKT
jgi:hypothetical protein